MTGENSTLAVPEGKTVTINCGLHITDESVVMPIYVFWNINNESLTSRGNVHISPPNNACVMITNISIGQRGKYSCFVCADYSYDHCNRSSGFIIIGKKTMFLELVYLW